MGIVVEEKVKELQTREEREDAFKYAIAMINESCGESLEWFDQEFGLTNEENEYIKSIA